MTGDTETADAVPAESGAEHERTRRRWLRRPRLSWLPPQLGALAVVVLVTLPAYVLAPGSFLLADKRVQYLPVMRDIGRRILAGEWPIIDPRLGPAGNYLLDVQYSIFDPFHWLVGICLTQIHSDDLAAYVWSLALLFLLATGMVALGLRLGLTRMWSVTLSASMVCSGFVLTWLAPYWMPGLMGLAFLPWWWAVLLAPERRSRIAVVGDHLLMAVLSWLVVSGGWPATWLIFAALHVAVLVEMVAGGRFRAWFSRMLASVAGGVAAGIVAINPILLNTFLGPLKNVHSTGILEMPPLDVLAFPSPTLTGNVQFYGGPVHAAITFFGWFLIALLWLVKWDRGLLRSLRTTPALLTALVGSVLTFLLTQMPSDVGAVRGPARALPGFALCVLVLVLVAWRASPARVTVWRLLGMLLTLAGVTAVAATGGGYHLVADVAGPLWVAAGCAFLVIAVRHHAQGAAAATALLGTVAGGLWLSLSAIDHPPFRYFADAPSYRGRPIPDLPTPSLLLLQRDKSVRYGQGVGAGFGYLTPTQRMMPGYSSLTPPGWRVALGLTGGPKAGTRKSVPRLVNEHAGEPNWRLAGLQSLVIQRGPILREWRRVLPPGWRPVAQTAQFEAFVGPQPSYPGRITGVVHGEADVQPVSVGLARQTYTVSTRKGATLWFSDPYFPDYRATVDGGDVPVTGTRGQVQVRLQPGDHGRLVVAYEPKGERLRRDMLLGGAGLLLVSVALGLLRRRRVARRPRA